MSHLIDARDREVLAHIAILFFLAAVALFSIALILGLTWKIFTAAAGGF